MLPLQASWQPRLLLRKIRAPRIELMERCGWGGGKAACLDIAQLCLGLKSSEEEDGTDEGFKITVERFTVVVFVASLLAV